MLHRSSPGDLLSAKDVRASFSSSNVRSFSIDSCSSTFNCGFVQIHVDRWCCCQIF